MSMVKSVTAMRSALLAIAMTFAFASAAHATSGRSFISGGGSDTNTATNCAATTPCRTLAAAYGITTAGGEIIALDSAGYGTLTITNAITIVASQPASISVAASGTGITINAGAGHMVILRGLEINGANASNTTGIVLNSGRLVLKDSTLKNLTTGLSVNSANADVYNSDIIGNITGVTTTGTGGDPNPNSAATTAVRIAGGALLDNTTGIFMTSPGTSKVSVYFYVPGGTSTSIPTNVAGNATLVNGSGTGCPCSSTGSYNTNGGFNFP